MYNNNNTQILAVHGGKKEKDTGSQLVEELKRKDHLLRTMKLKDALSVNVGLVTLDMRKYINIDGLLDSGATGMFMDKTFTLNHKLSTRKLAKSIPVYNIDGSHNL
jgi:hypothetical protein